MSTHARSHKDSAQSRNSAHNFEIGAHYHDLENAQHSFEITQIDNLRGAYMQQVTRTVHSHIIIATQWLVLLYTWSPLLYPFQQIYDIETNTKTSNINKLKKCPGRVLECGLL